MVVDIIILGKDIFAAENILVGKNNLNTIVTY